jgi:hypothetical protein
VEIVDSSQLESSTEASQLAVPQKKSIASWKKYVAAVVALGVVSQFYFFRELFVALLIFTILFLMFSAIVGAIYLIGRVGQKGIEIAEPAARRGLVYAEVISKKTFHRPRSAPVQ